MWLRRLVRERRQISSIISGSGRCFLSRKCAVNQYQVPPPVQISAFSIGRRPFSSLQLSKRDFAELEDQVGRSKRMALSDSGTFQILLRLPTLLHPSLQQLKETVREQTEQEINSWMKTKGIDDQAFSVNVEAIASRPIPFMAQLVDDPENLEEGLGPGLASITHFVAVYSCKGGVGKSTVAANLAYELARKGGRVGILDVDIYGPSLPLLASPDDIAVRRSPKGSGMVFPIDHQGVKLLSLGYVAVKSGVPGSGENNGAAVMRGPLAGKVVTQLLKGTDWGELDVLILDMPPGTGDVQLTICQDIHLSGVVAVTTPSRLAIEDTKKGIEMFTSMGVPTLSVVENMSYFVCDGGTVHYPFGKGIERLSTDDLDVVKLPITDRYNCEEASKDPLTLSRPPNATEQLQAFDELANVVSKELLCIQHGQTDQDQINVSLDQRSFPVGTLQVEKARDDAVLVRFFSKEGATQKLVSGKRLRATDPKTGDLLESSPFYKDLEEDDNDDPVVTSSRQSPSILPVKVQRKGRYGFAIEFADGGTVIYNLLSLARAAGATVMD